MLVPTEQVLLPHRLPIRPPPRPRTVILLLTLPHPPELTFQWRRSVSHSGQGLRATLLPMGQPPLPPPRTDHPAVAVMPGLLLTLPPPHPPRTRRPLLLRMGLPPPETMSQLCDTPRTFLLLDIATSRLSEHEEAN